MKDNQKHRLKICPARFGDWFRGEFVFEIVFLELFINRDYTTWYLQHIVLKGQTFNHLVWMCVQTVLTYSHYFTPMFSNVSKENNMAAMMEVLIKDSGDSHIHPSNMDTTIGKLP